MKYRETVVPEMDIKRTMEMLNRSKVLILKGLVALVAILTVALILACSSESTSISE